MPRIPLSVLTGLTLGLSVSLAAPAHAQSIDYGDDSSMWANDGECDDPRFEGVGMATTLLESDIRRDATDCRLGVEAGRLRVRGTAGATASGGQTVDGIDFGDDSSMWANDNECDDPRFEGPGMTATTLLDSDIRRDATDCRTAYEAGMLTYIAGTTGGGTGAGAPTGQVAGGINFGDDSSMWSNDDECDDPRFEGPGMTLTPLLDSDIARDATDCRTAFEAGRLTLRPGADPMMSGASGGGASQSSDGIDFGNDSSMWANDGECDDMRFSGPGMTTTLLIESDIGADATDCRTAYEAGQLEFIGLP